MNTTREYAIKNQIEGCTASVQEKLIKQSSILLEGGFTPEEIACILQQSINNVKDWYGVIAEGIRAS